jgi:hypothetical protein
MLSKVNSPNIFMIVQKLSYFYSYTLICQYIVFSFSLLFLTSLGVRQGGVASPKLFSIYIEDIVKEIRKNKAGIKIKNSIIDIIMFADDINVVATTNHDLQSILGEHSEHIR